MTSDASNAGPSENAALPQPVVDDVCERTCELLSRSEVFTEDQLDAVRQLLRLNRDRLKASDILEALSPATEEPREDS